MSNVVEQERPDDIRYRQLMADIARGSGAGWLRRGRAMRTMKEDRLYLQSGATTFHKWAKYVFSAARYKAALSEMDAAKVYDDAVSEGLSPPPTLAIAAAIGSVKDGLDICRSANDIAKHDGRDIASPKDYQRAIFEYVQGDGDLEGIAKSVAHGRQISIMAAKVNSVVSHIETHKNDSGYEAISECWHQIGAFLRRSWAALRSSVPWAICPHCLAGGPCPDCQGRGWITRRQLQDLLQGSKLSDVQIRASKLVSEACKYARNVPPSYMFARKMGLKVCIRCCAPVRYGLTCDLCTDRSRSGISKQQVTIWVKLAQENISRNPDRALEFVEEIATAAESWTGDELGFHGYEPDSTDA